jgi:GAF domain-containing protein
MRKNGAHGQHTDEDRGAHRCRGAPQEHRAIAGSPFRQRGLEPATQQVVDAAKALFRADGAGLMLIGEGEVLRWVTATDPRAQVLEAAQERLGEGPCVEAFEQGVPQLIADSGAEERWPELTRVLRHDGVHAVLSVPVQVAQGIVGSLNFYLAKPHAWGP